MPLTAPNVARLRPSKTMTWHLDRAWCPASASAATPAAARSGASCAAGTARPAARVFARSASTRISGWPTPVPRRAQILADPSAVQPRVRPTDAPPPDTFGTLAEQFLGHGRTKRGRELRASTTREYRRALMTYAAGLHDRPVRRSARRRGRPGQHRRRRAGHHHGDALPGGAEPVVQLADRQGQGGVQPRDGHRGLRHARADRVLTDGELAAIWAADEDGTDFGLILRLLLWTGARRSEVGGMRWSELADGTWTVPGTRTKNHRPLVLPLPRQALAALQAHPRGVGRTWFRASARPDFRRGPR